jgi:tetratricopeptide (TPR) repeat protein
MGKVLRPTTIIPETLYVERSADRQLEQIINDMGRPGYVLVARQMGKTNLLINMKRRRERVGDIVPYFDLTNRFDTPKALFRHIIDSIIEAASLTSVKGQIVNERKEIFSEPNVEYDRHLRVILKAVVPHKIVIVLDEIDSLVSITYSDEVFSQIRSMYFSRINHREYELLTYVLSGVAEPTDLIKDKNISPFNIGEKIYLDDFTYEEFNLLLERAKLPFSKEVGDEIYGWTSGNPRMTWDLCSQVEDQIIEGKIVSKAEVLNAVQKLYLTQFDQAPIDHIRYLAENDAQIRNAVMSIRWGKADTLDEKAKNRLYLAGIGRSAPGQRPAIKNKIIDAALSDAWLTQIAISREGLLEAAEESFQGGRYNEAIRLIEEYAKEAVPAGKLPLPVQLRLGVSRYFSGEFESASDDLRTALAGDLNEEARATCRYYLGSALLKGGNADESIQYFRDAIEHKGRLRLAAKMALGSALLSNDLDKYFDEIILLNNQIIDEVGQSENEEIADIEKAELVASAHFNLAQAFQLKSRDREAGQHLDDALANAPVAYHPAILLKRSGDSSILFKSATEAANIIIENKLVVSQGLSHSLNLSEEILGVALALLITAKDQRLFLRLLDYTRSEIYSERLSNFEILMQLFKSNLKKRTILISLVITALDHFIEGAKPDLLFGALRYSAFYQSGLRKVEAFDRYLVAIKSRVSANSPMDEEDLAVLVNQFYSLFEAKKYRDALAVVDAALIAQPKVVNPAAVYQVVLLYQKFLAHKSLNDTDRGRVAAEKLLREVGDELPEKYRDMSGTIGTFKKRANEYLKATKLDPFRKFGRNERIAVKNVETGAISFVKFKEAEVGLREGRLILSNPTEA